MEKEYRKISSLKGWDKNPRSIKDKDFQRLKRMIEKLGEFKPLIILEDGTVLGGNMRLRVYKELGWGEAWVSVVEADTEKEKLEYALADNERAGFYDGDLLANLTGEFPDFEWGDYAVDLKPPVTLADLFPEDVEEDEAPAVAEGEPISKLGEVYELGRHRLMCGDATKKEDVDKLMNGQKADMVFTDPPYNINYKGQGKNTSNTIMADNVTDDAFNIFLDKVFKNYKENTKAGGGNYVFHASRTQIAFENALAKNNYEIKNQLIWNKPMSALGWGDYRWKHEPFFYCGQKGSTLQFYGDRTHSTVWDFQKSEEELIKWAKREKYAEKNGKTTIWSMKRDNVNEYVHPTQKPVELISHALFNSTKQDDIVLDLFGGSGSTLIACEQTNRICYMMELDPKYCDVIRKRYENFVQNKEKQA